VKPAKIIPIVVVGWCLAVFVYGMLMYSDAPFKACADGPYCGKTHRHHTEAEYHSFIQWQTALFVSWPFGMVAAYVLRRQKKRQAGK
jgi:hypothetical protein